MKNPRVRELFLVAALAMTLLAPTARADRVKDLASVSGVRGNQLVGYGLVIGLDGTGDQTSQAPFTVQSIKSMLARFGVTVPATVNPQLKNVAAVVVTADLPAFSKLGTDHRRHRFFHRQRGLAARWHAADDAAEGRRW